MGKLSFPISLLSGASAVTIAIADLATAGLPAGTILRDPTTGLIYGQSDGAGGYTSAFGGTMYEVNAPYLINGMLEF